MTQVFATLSHYLAPYFAELSLMLTATILVVYGDLINKWVKRMIAPYHFVVRSILFVLLCAFGYGALTLYGAPFVLHIMKYLPYAYQGAGFVLAFIIIGILAERRSYI